MGQWERGKGRTGVEAVGRLETWRRFPATLSGHPSSEGLPCTVYKNKEVGPRVQILSSTWKCKIHPVARTVSILSVDCWLTKFIYPRTWLRNAEMDLSFSCAPPCQSSE